MDLLIGVATILVVCGLVAAVLVLTYTWMPREDGEQGPGPGSESDQSEPRAQEVSASSR